VRTSRFELRQAQLAHGGTILSMPVLPEGVGAPFEHAWGYLRAGGAMEAHSHPAHEVYFFHKGDGIVEVGDEQRYVGAGDVVEIPPDVQHSVRNHADGELLWFALWWSPTEA